MTGTAARGLPSIRRRLSTVLLLAALGGGLMTALLVSLALQHVVDALLDGALQESAEILYGPLQPLTESPGALTGSLEAPPHDERLVWQLVSARGEVLLRSSKAPLQRLVAPRREGLADSALGWRVYSLVLPGDAGTLQVAQSLAERQRSRWEVVAATVGMTLLVGGIVAFWTRQRVRRELRLLAAFSQAVRDYDPTSRDAVSPAALREELLPVQAAVLALGERLAQRVDSERAFSAHAAHALRTPLAGLDAQLALAQRECEPGLDQRLHERLELAREATSRLARVVAALLTLFRASSRPHLQSVAIGALTAAMPFEGLSISVDPAASLDADPDLLAAALFNLLENAARHGATRVDLGVRHEAGAEVLRIEDNGRCIRDERRLAMAQALERQTYDTGVGLGLTLADRVARAHGGALHLLPSAPGAVLELWLQSQPSA